MSWEVTVQNVQDTDSEANNKIPKLDPQVSTRGRWIPVPDSCVDASFSPDISFTEGNALEALGLNTNSEPWSDLYPERFESSGDGRNLVSGNGDVISRYEYEVTGITSTIGVNRVVNKGDYECAFSLTSEAIAGVKTNQKNDSDLFKIYQYIKNGSVISAEVDTRVASIIKEHNGSPGYVDYEDSVIENPSTTYLGTGEALQTDSEIYSAGWPLMIVNPFTDIEDDVATISWGGEDTHYYSCPEDDCDFDQYIGAQIQWTLDLLGTTVAPKYEYWSYCGGDERPGFIKPETKSPIPSQSSSLTPQWPFSYFYELSPALKRVRIHVARAKCFGLWTNVLNINVNAHWETDRVFNQPVSVPATLRVDYKGQTHTLTVTPPGYMVGDKTCPDDSVATIGFYGNGDVWIS